MAAGPHRGPSAQHGPHVDHGARAHHRADVDNGPHHNDGPFADFHLLPDDGAGLDTGFYPLQIQQGHAGVPAVVLNDKVGDLLPAGLQNGAQLRPVAEDGEAVLTAEDLGRSKVHGSGGVHIELDRGLLFRVRDIVDDLLCVHKESSIKMRLRCRRRGWVNHCMTQKDNVFLRFFQEK